MARSGPIIPGVDQRVVEKIFADPVTSLVFVKDVAVLLKDCTLDPRIPRRNKWVLAAVAAYLATPIDLIPDGIPIIGQIDDLTVVVLGLRHLLRAAGAGIVRDLWRGSDDGLALVMSAAGMHSGKDTV